MPSETRRRPFFGAYLASLRTPEANLISAEYSPNQFIPEHRHNSAYWCLVLSGEYSERVGGDTRAYGPAMSIFHPAGELHSDQFSRYKGRLFMAEPTEDFLRHCGEAGIAFDDRIESAGGPMSLAMARIHEEALSAEQHSSLVIEGLLLELAGWMARQASRKDRKPPAWLQRIRERMQDEYASSFQFGKLAAFEGVSPVDLARNFRRYFGSTAGNYLRQVRLEAACRLLRDSDEALATVAVGCGFASQSHFSSTLRRLRGCTPLQYRSRYRRPTIEIRRND